MNDTPLYYAENRHSWRRWLAENHATSRAVWLVYDKGANRKLSWQDIVQEALCFGWIDGRAGKVSETQSKLYVSKRSPKSVWSKINKDHVENLIATGLMTPAGQAAIDEARRNGSWDALNKSDALEIPEDLAIMFETHQVARDNFKRFSNSSKRIILAWIYDAKREETRAKRVLETVRLATQNIKAR